MDETPNANRFTAAGLGIAAATIIAWLLEEFAGVAPPGPVVAGFSVVLGAVVQAIYSLFPGFHSSRSSDARSPWWVVVVLLPFLWLVGCSSNPLSAAESAEQRAYAAYGTFVVLEERAASLMSEPTVPDSAKARIQSLDARLKPMADSLKDSALLVADVRRDLAAGETTEQRLDIVTAELEGWLTRFLPLLGEFQQAVGR